MKQKLKRTKGGFTLIEVIITIVVLAILAAMIASYYSQSFTHSSAPIASQIKYLGLNQVMEKISVEYAKYPHWRQNKYYASGTIILPPEGATKGYQYSTSGGTSGTTEPSPWPITAGGTVTDNGMTWTRSATCAPALRNNNCTTGCTCPTGLQDLIGTEGQNYTNTFGSYNVINNHFITFDATNTESSLQSFCTSNPTNNNDCRYLKVTIGFRSDDANRTAETLTTLFVLR